MEARTNGQAAARGTPMNGSAIQLTTADADVHQRETGRLTGDTLGQRVPEGVDETGEEYEEDDGETHERLASSSNRT